MSAPRAEESPRLATLDFLRGVAVMGILAMNIVGFALPHQSYVSYAAYGADTPANLTAWAFGYVFVDGKMRAIFSLLFGASMLLIVERARGQDEDPWRVHSRRMAWLLLFGLLHYALIWEGDILTQYALIGLAAYPFTAMDRRQLLERSLIFFAFAFIVFAFDFGSLLWAKLAAAAPGASVEAARTWHAMEAEMARPTSTMLAEELGRYRGGYGAIAAHRLAGTGDLLVSLVTYAPETLAYMLLGMWGLKSGFLAGAWEAGRYRRTAFLCLAIGLPAYAFLAWVTARSGFDAVHSVLLQNIAAMPFRPLTALGYCALLIALVKNREQGWLTQRISAAGRAAFTNYLGTSIAMTMLFYGYGLGWFGKFGRADLWLVVVMAWAAMLLWSKPWLDRYRYGPFEWLWRSLARGSAQPMRLRAPD